MKKDNKSYDFAKKNKAGVSAALRGMISLYLAYSAWGLIRTAGEPGNTMPAWGSWLVGGLFAAVAAAFGWFAWKCYKKDLAEAELTDEELADLEPTALPEEKGAALDAPDGSDEDAAAADEDAPE